MTNLNLDDLRVEAHTFATEQSLESTTVGQGVSEVGASIGTLLCCTIACCGSVEQQ